MNQRLSTLARRTVSRRSPTRSWFEEAPLPLTPRNIFDLGVVDLNQDGNLGIFTTNHNSRQSLLANRGGGVFEDVLDEMGLNHDAAFPGWDEDVTRPHLGSDGLYLYHRHNVVVVERTGGGPDVVTVELGFLSPVGIEHRANVEVEMEHPGGADTGEVTVRCRARAGTRLEVSPELVAIPMTVRVDRRLPLSQVFVGSTMTIPASHDFTLHLRDRHAMAWSDQDGDGQLDVFVLRGGLKGRLEQFPGMIGDELFLRRGGRFADEWAASGMGKGSCRGRQAAWVDLGGGQRPALFMSCLASSPRIYRQCGEGRFTAASEELGMDLVGGGAYAWVDVDGDGRAELVTAGGGELTVYKRSAAGPFAPTQTVTLRSKGDLVAMLAVADSRGEGRPDIFAPSMSGNTLLLNEDGRYRAVDPQSVGLPGHGGITAHWVDYDNDGLVDLYVLPGGLFRQRRGGRYKPTRLLDDELFSPIADVRATWFDADNGGARDLVVAVTPEAKVQGGDFVWHTRFFRNAGASNHWLQVELTGPGTNRQAIGSAVTVRVGDRTSTQWVGCNEGSHYSQGHYRLYFGLGDQPAVSSLQVRWSDGSVEEFGSAGDELVRIVQSSPDHRAQ